MIGLTGILKLAPENSRNYIVVDGTYGDDAKAALNPFKRDSFFLTIDEALNVQDFTNPLTIVIHPGTYTLGTNIYGNFLTVICLGNPTIIHPTGSVFKFRRTTYNANDKITVLGNGNFIGNGSTKPVFDFSNTDAYIEGNSIQKIGPYYGAIWAELNSTVVAKFDTIDCSTNLGNVAFAQFGANLTINCRVAKFSWIGLLVQDHLAISSYNTVLNFTGRLEAYDYISDPTLYATTYLMADETGNATINFNGRMVDKKTITDTGIFGAIVQASTNIGDINVYGQPSTIKTATGILKKGGGNITLNADFENTQGTGANIQSGLFRMNNCTLKTSFTSTTPRNGIDYLGGNIVLDSAKIVVNNPVTAYSINPSTSMNYKVYSAYSNAPVSTSSGTLTNLITGGTFIVDSDVQ